MQRTVNDNGPGRNAVAVHPDKDENQPGDGQRRTPGEALGHGQIDDASAPSGQLDGGPAPVAHQEKESA
jgi:hypothetical protein